MSILKRTGLPSKRVSRRVNENETEMIIQALYMSRARLLCISVRLRIHRSSSKIYKLDVIQFIIYECVNSK